MMNIPDNQLVKEFVACLYCQTKNDITEQQCSHCGMPLATRHPNNKTKRMRFFRNVFWLLVLFCAAMMYYLPR